MKSLSLNELREKYLAFFESKGHLRLPSFSLVPKGDKSLLLINSGMAPMKKYFTGEVTPPRNRVTTCQKCIRTPDLERVGHTARHGTFFEMLGNFSFGDYFKKEAIAWSWEFLTDPAWLGMPKDRLWPSVYESDDEAYALWRDMIGVPESRIVRMGKADNFWEHGAGPCGPCSEIYFDRGEKYGCGSPDCRPGCDCDRYMEIWNNVFSQFENDGQGNYTELKQKNIDTGMGLERLACAVQDVDNMFVVDTNLRILEKVCEIAGKAYGSSGKDDISIRVCTDHIKSAMFMICDGVVPSNEGRGYVLRRIIRRACRHGKLLGIDRPFMAELLSVALAQNEGAYPELAERSDYIRRVLSIEEERFNCTIDAGLSMLEKMLEQMSESGERTLDGAEAFKLYDTYGFPYDLTLEIAKERGCEVDEATFRTLMGQQRERARAARGNIGGWSDSSKNLLSDLPKTVFEGYEACSTQATVVAILGEDSALDSVSEGDVSVIFDRTVCYGEGGGQVGDSGTAANESVSLSISDTKKADGVFIHLCTVENGTLSVGDSVTVSYDKARRDSIRRNHSACHLLQAALRRVLGTHIEQAGSYVDERRVRFDFTHYAPLTEQERAAVERAVNEQILLACPVVTTVTDVESARKSGAMALFDEKYGDAVRMVQMGDFSLELCGGTHVSSTGAVGLFRILSESSVAAGVRRIEGTTGYGVLEELFGKEQLLASVARELKAQSAADAPARVLAMKGEIRELKKSLESAQGRLAEAQTTSLVAQAKQVGGVRLLTASLDMTADAARTLCDTLKAKYADMVAVFATVKGEKLNFISVCGSEAVRAGAHAGNLLKAVSAVTGGKGGGRPDSAMSGGKEIAKVKEALAEAENVLKAQLQ